MARLSKGTPNLPGGDVGLRELLNRMVLDVRAACRILLDKSDKRRRLDPYGIAGATDEVAANTLLA